VTPYHIYKDARPCYTVGMESPMLPVEYRLRILESLKAVVCRDRMATYSDAEFNFAHIAGRWTLLFNQLYKINIKVEAHHVALAMCDVKMSRLAATDNHRDSWLDLAGYGICGLGIVDKRLDQEKDAGPIKPPVGEFEIGKAHDNAIAAARQELLKERQGQ